MTIQKKLQYSLIERYAKACDASLYHYLPEAVLYANDIKDIKQIIEYASQNKKNITFRAAGTSLSGQTVSNGIIVDISRSWKNFKVIENGKYIKSEVGVTGSKLNFELMKFGKRFGPDPASINSAMIGGILANNSSGMSSGIERNPYNALHSIRFVLSSGNEFDTDLEDDYDRFINQEKEIAEFLINTRNEILLKPHLISKIQSKYSLKNTIGYGLNSFIDFSHPLDILSHLLIGSEGTLGFICDATFKTEDLLPEKFTGLLLFSDVFSTCKAIDILKNNGADALEIMDGRCLFSVNDLKDIPEFIKSSKLSDYGLLFQFSQTSKEASNSKQIEVSRICKDLTNLIDFQVTDNIIEQKVLWSIRKGLLASLGASRPRGTSFILEDVAVRLNDLPNAILDLKMLLDFYKFDTGIYGHGIDGNLHFMLAEDFSKSENIEKFDNLLRSLSDLIVDKYDGSLKAEHGTGRNMAPFVAKEWGSEIYDIMKQTKSKIDVNNIFNSNVVISDDAKINLKNIKSLPLVSEKVDKCIECGFCENSCPSRNITLTPRQRIQIAREFKRLDINSNEYKVLKNEYQYYGIDTCAKDGVCSINCPVKINTADLIKEIMFDNKSKFANVLADKVSDNLVVLESIMKTGISIGSSKYVNSMTKNVNKITKVKLPIINHQFKPVKSIFSQAIIPDILYIPACTSRLMGGGEERDLVNQHIYVAERIGINIKIPNEIYGKCCGLSFSSKGFKNQSEKIEKDFIEFIKSETNNFEIPVLIDSSSCYYHLLQNNKGINLLDTLGFIELHLEKIKLEFKNIPIFNFFPNCSIKVKNDIDKISRIIHYLSPESKILDSPYCCGSAGDKGIVFPEIVSSSFKNVDFTDFENNCYSSNISCELSINTYLGTKLKSLIYIFL
jgi:D-lactate dehydrogenase